MKNTGIWLDRKQALIVNLTKNEGTVKIVHSDIDNFNSIANKHVGGAKEIIKDRESLEREKHQFKSYFKNIVQELNGTEALVIFGPAETFEKFAKELEEHYKHISTKIKGIKRADSMTENQVIAWVRDFFEPNEH
jgi:stalled ribosome rescue protein Dom34